MSNFLCLSGVNFLIARSTSDNEIVDVCIFFTSGKIIIKIKDFVKGFFVNCSCRPWSADVEPENDFAKISQKLHKNFATLCYTFVVVVGTVSTVQNRTNKFVPTINFV